MPALTVEVFWCDLGGTMGYTANLSRSVGGTPAVDFTQADAAQFRLKDAAGVERFQSATILSDPAPTATTISIRHALVPGDFTGAGDFALWAEVSLDTGVTWYVSGVAILHVLDTGVS